MLDPTWPPTRHNLQRKPYQYGRIYMQVQIRAKWSKHQLLWSLRKQSHIWLLIFILCLIPFYKSEIRRIAYWIWNHTWWRYQIYLLRFLSLFVQGSPSWIIGFRTRMGDNLLSLRGSTSCEEIQELQKRTFHKLCRPLVILLQTCFFLIKLFD